MSKYDSQLSSLSPAEIIGRLEGQGGLLAISNRELFFVDDHTQQSTRLSSIKRIGVNKETGKVEVSGETGTLMEISPKAFQRDELKSFLESLKGHVLRAKSMPTEVGMPAPVEPPPAPPEAASVHSPAEPLGAAPAAPRSADPHTLEEEPPVALPETPEPPTRTPDPALNIVEPPRTLPDEPSDSLWAYEGAPKTEPDRNRSVPAAQPNPPVDNLTVPPPPYIAPTQSPTQRGGMVWLKVWALVTLVFVLVYMYLFFTTSLPGRDVYNLLEVVVFGVALAGIQWRFSEPL